jgi:transcription-repair coupling factor (superfamily II helicase)
VSSYSFECFNTLKPGQRHRLAGHLGSSDSYWLAQAIQSSSLKTPCLVLIADPTHTLRWEEELTALLPHHKIQLFPDWETLPYDRFSPHPDLISQRLATLDALLHQRVDVIVAHISTALYRLPPTSYIAGSSFHLKLKDRLDIELLRSQLVQAHYQNVQQVLAPGEFALRGAIFDIFPMGSVLPYRVELFDDEVESIRTFDADTQRTLYPVQQINLLPAREFPLDEEGRSLFRQAFRETFEGDPSQAQLYKDISKGLTPGGIEYYLPLFFKEKPATLLDYLPEGAPLVLHGAIEEAIQHFWKETQSRYRLLRGDKDCPLLSPELLFLPEEQFFQALKRTIRLDLASPYAPDTLLDVFQVLPDVAIQHSAADPIAALRRYLEQQHYHIALCAESAGRRETLSDLLQHHGISILPESAITQIPPPPGLSLHVSPLQSGFVDTHAQIAWITENNLSPRTATTRSRHKEKRSSSTPLDLRLRNLAELQTGEAVVHEDHGIGRYCGLISMDMGEGLTEFLHLEYANKATLYVPVDSLHLINRYSGMDSEHAPLHTLGSGQWEKARTAAAKKVRDTAAELLALYAKRALRKGQGCKLNMDDYQRFCAAFGFETTDDQQQAIDAVVQDLLSDKPMDRLICGDVGFGKTEVALRAAFVALMDGRQVAVLVPTTLLAEQHYQTFLDRFAEYPIKVAELSRFRTKKEIDIALKGLASGEVDLVIGTHKLIQDDVQFNHLGLVIIDEEHRFGVRQKERMKALRAEVDVLTLTATPIPRTLSMAMEGLRDFSVIATAPQKRLSVKTFVRPFSDGLIREGVLREFKRGGQVYFLHNEIDTIENRREKLEVLLPEARIAVGHGQMHERDLERVMRDFYQQRCNLLLCSTIIETGIDVPNANTIFMERADKLGLAQLHQLRGRVGRSHHQAYAYLLTPSSGEGAVSAQAKKRLDAIQLLEDLGSGFYLSMHDLEIRGAGEILGDSQSGDIQEIGLSLYTSMLNRAIHALKKGEVIDPSAPPQSVIEIRLHTPAILPNDYCPDVHERLVLYKRLADVEHDDNLIALKEELIDRFGKLPDAARALLTSHRLRLRCTEWGVLRLDLGSDRIQIRFGPQLPFDSNRLIETLQKDRRFKLVGSDQLSLHDHFPTLDARVQMVEQLFKQWMEPVKKAKK